MMESFELLGSSQLVFIIYYRDAQHPIEEDKERKRRTKDGMNREGRK
jgi:hypothetical protein